MARQLRVTYEGAVDHVTARGNERHAIVREQSEGPESRVRQRGRR